MLYYAQAKLNLTLEVWNSSNSSIPTGYHEIKSVMTTLEMCDLLRFSKEGDGIKLTANHPTLTTGPSNLIIRSAKAFFHATRLPSNIKIYLEKRIPIGAGLGGGSADAAATLLALNELYNTNLSQKELEYLGCSLGADVPFCIRKGTALATGIGNKLESLPEIPPAWILLVIPSFTVNTSWAYRALDDLRVETPSINLNSSEQLCALIKKGEWDQLPFACQNDFQELLEGQYTFLKYFKKVIIEKGALNVTLTGSGSALAAWVPDEETGVMIAQFIASSSCKEVLPECKGTTAILTRIASVFPWSADIKQEVKAICDTPH